MIWNILFYIVIPLNEKSRTKDIIITSNSFLQNTIKQIA